MPQQFSNNARSVLQSTITDTATSLTIASGAADLFPTANVGTGSIPSVNNWFKATIQDVSGNVEIIYVRTRNAGSAVFSNILRAQEGTTARTFVAGSVVGLRVTAADIQASINIPGADNTFTGDNTFAQPINGDLVGDVTGNLTGSVTGNVTGNAGTVTNGVYTTGNQSIAGNKTFTGTVGIGANWTLAQSGTDLVFSYNGTAVFKITSAGAIVAKDNVTAYGTV
jgi:hypothetical protein